MWHLSQGQTCEEYSRLSGEAPAPAGREEFQAQQAGGRASQERDGSREPDGRQQIMELSETLRKLLSPTS